MTEHADLARPSWLEASVAQEIMSAVSPVAAAFDAAGHTLFLVGGVVRDLSLGVKGSVTDLDLTTDAEPATTRSLLSPLARELWTQGERFGTIGATIGEWAIEVTTHRGESYESDSRKPVVTFGTDLLTDLSRRDFTINAMALDAQSGVLHDPFQGAEDLANRTLRTPLDPAISFTDDPLRMMRAARFIPRFDLSVDGDVRSAVVAHRERLDIVSRERIHDELERLLALPEPASGLVFLAETGLLDHVMPTLTSPAGVAADAASLASSPSARRSVLASHVADAAAWLEDLRYSTADRRSTQRLVEGYETMKASSTTERGSAPATRRLVSTVGRDAMRDLFDGANALSLDIEPWTTRLTDLERSEDLDDLGAPLSGGEIIETLGVAPGPLVGEFSRRLTEARLEGGPMTVAEARGLLRTWFDAADDPNGDHR